MKDQKEVVKKVIDYIEGNLEQEIRLDSISKNIGYSKFYLNRIFTERTGITMYKYIQNRRLTIAAEKLVKTGFPCAILTSLTTISLQEGRGLPHEHDSLCNRTNQPRREKL